MEVLETAYETRSAGKNIQGNKIYDVAVTVTPELRGQLESVAKLTLRTQDGTLVALGQLADIRHSVGRYNVLHQGAQRRQTVTCNVLNRDLAAFMDELRDRVLKGIAWLPSTHAAINPDQPATATNWGLSYPEFTGAAIEQARARHDLVLHALLASVGVLIFIYIAIGSVRHMLLALVNVPFALIGGVIAVLVTGATVSVGSVVGFVTLFGITVRNSIMLLSHYHYLVEIEGKKWGMETAVLGAQERFPSVLMTALVTALAMFPVAFNSDNPGLEIMGPMAAIIVGGLASSTVLNLLLLPGMLLCFGKFRV
jgi:Cu/Ag efflux pump CusA